MRMGLGLPSGGAAATHIPPPQGWIDPATYTGIPYENDYGVKFYSNGATVYPMMEDAVGTKAGWRTGLASAVNPGDGLTYVSVSIARVFDPSAQGVSPTLIYVNNITGNDTTGDGSSGLPYKTVEKAIGVAVADGVNTIFEIRVSTSTFIGANSAGWNSATQEIGAKKIKIIGVGATKPWLLPSMRNSYTKATFAWSDMGGGIWKTTAAGISTTARNTPILFDLSVLDINGMPTPGVGLPGPYADEAAILAALTAIPTGFHTTAANALYVKLASLGEPDPGVNFAYSELKTGGRFDIEEGGSLMIENFRCIHNTGSASGSIFFFARPNTFTQGASAPNVVHDNSFILKDCEIYGSSGNGFGMQSITRFIVEGCKDGYCWLDGVSSHSLYAYPANSNDPAEGSAQHTWVDGHLSMYHGPNGFIAQAAENASSNSITDHARGRSTVLNARCGYSNGSNLAFVGGAKCFAINSAFSNAKTVTPATDTYQANYLSSGVAAGDAADGSAIWALWCSGIVSGGVQFYGAGVSKIVAVSFTGVKSKLLLNTATLKDGAGNDI